MKGQHFTKYDEGGAYHWDGTFQRKRARRSPRLHARYDIPLRLLQQRLDIRNSRGVDLGCGDGVMLYKVHLLQGHAAGLDASAEGLALARQELTERGHEDCELIHGSCYEVPLADASVDYVTAIEVIEHLEEVDQFLAEVRRILRPGGWFVCTTPNRAEGQAPDAVRDPFHVHEFIAEELREALGGTFSDVKVWGAYPRWLDRIYVRGKESGWVDRGVRVLFRAVAFGLGNPYVYALREAPDHRYELLVGAAQK